MEEQEKEVVMILFGVPRELAIEALQKAGKELKRIRKYIMNKARKKGVESVRCKMCGKKLTDPDSISRGYGSECYEKLMAEKYSFDFGGEDVKRDTEKTSD